MRYIREPRKHQKKAFKRSVDKEYFGLLMERGTGKTKVVIDTAQWMFEKGWISSLMVIAPNDVHERWITEHLEKDFPPEILRRSMVWKGSKGSKDYYNGLTKLLEQDESFKIFAINIEAFVSKKAFNYCARFLKKHDTLFVVDESTRIKTPNIKRTRAVLRLSKLAPYRRILTGNEVTNSPFDVYSQFKALHWNFWNGLSFFIFKHYFGTFKKCVALDGKGREYNYEKLTGFKNLHEIQNKINPHIFRVKKKDCLDLPEKIYSPISVELNKEQKKVYKDLKEELMAEYCGECISVVNKLSLLIRFRQICGGFFPGTTVGIGENPKLKALLYDLEDQKIEAIIIWASFVPEIELLVRELSKIYKDKKVQGYYGKTKKKERKEVVGLFQAGKIDILVANPEVAGTGLNLQRSNLHYYFSNSFKPEPRWQSEDRSHRDGQHWPVVYKDIIAKDTADEKVVKALIAKEKLSHLFERPLEELL